MANRPSAASLVCLLLGCATAVAGVAKSLGAGTMRSDGVRHTPVVEAVKKAAPAVVNISTAAGGRGWGTGATRGSGSGVLVHPAGYVVTNSHVVRGQDRITVDLSKASGSGTKTFEARLVEDDPAHDLAILRISGRPTFPYLSLCSTCEVLVGETAIAIGNPYGLGDTVTVGIVSAFGRSATLSNGSTLTHLIQTDASINLGSSGGALVNLEGELIGVNSSMHPSARGIAFTVPADDVQALLDRALGSQSRPPPPPPVGETPVAVAAPPLPPAAAPAGAKPAPVAPPSTSSGRTPVGLSLRPGTGGLLVSAVTPLSNADIAGVVAGDLVVEVDGAAAPSVDSFWRSVQSAPAGKTYSLVVVRSGKRLPVVLLVPQ
jgi:S1-C subfamily serine protease